MEDTGWMRHSPRPPQATAQRNLSPPNFIRRIMLPLTGILEFSFCSLRARESVESVAGHSETQDDSRKAPHWPQNQLPRCAPTINSSLSSSSYWEPPALAGAGPLTLPSWHFCPWRAPKSSPESPVALHPSSNFLHWLGVRRSQFL